MIFLKKELFIKNFCPLFLLFFYFYFFALKRRTNYFLPTTKVFTSGSPFLPHLIFINFMTNPSPI